MIVWNIHSVDYQVMHTVVDGGGGQENVEVVVLVVLSDPGSDESPEGFHSGVSTETGSLLCLTCFNK